MHLRRFIQSVVINNQRKLSSFFRRANGDTSLMHTYTDSGMTGIASFIQPKNGGYLATGTENDHVMLMRFDQEK